MFIVLMERHNFEETIRVNGFNTVARLKMKLKMKLKLKVEQC